jgi:hypothetical protein
MATDKNNEPRDRDSNVVVMPRPKPHPYTVESKQCRVNILRILHEQDASITRITPHYDDAARLVRIDVHRHLVSEEE